MNKRNLTGTAIAAVLALGVGAQLHTSVSLAHSAQAAPHKTIKIGEKDDKYTFGLPKITVKAGTKVTWLNKSDAPHTVTGKGTWKFSSKTFEQDKSVSVTFKKAGTYSYYCAIHPYMKAKVIVTK